MKRRLAYLVAVVLAAFPMTAQAQSVDLIYDDNVIEASAALVVTEVPTEPPVTPGAIVPAVQFDAPGPGVYALDSISFSLRQGPEEEPILVMDGAPTVFASAVTPESYPVTVQIWKLAEGSTTEYEAGPAIDAVFSVGEKGWYDLILTDEPTDEKVIFTGSIRVGIFLREVLPAPDPAPPVLNLGVDEDGTDSTPAMPFGNSYDFDSSAETWTDVDLNYGIRAAVHSVPAMSCVGFQAPLNHTVTMKKGGRTLPLKARLFDADGFPVKRSDLAARPLVQLLFGEVESTDVAPAGNSNTGMAFRSAGNGKWIYNLKTKKSYQPGIYTVQMISGDVTEYVIDPTCVGTFEILAPAPKKPKHGNGNQ